MVNIIIIKKWTSNNQHLLLVSCSEPIMLINSTITLTSQKLSTQKVIIKKFINSPTTLLVKRIIFKMVKITWLNLKKEISMSQVTNQMSTISSSHWLIHSMLLIEKTLLLHFQTDMPINICKEIRKRRILERQVSVRKFMDSYQLILLLFKTEEKKFHMLQTVQIQDLTSRKRRRTLERQVSVRKSMDSSQHTLLLSKIEERNTHMLQMDLIQDLMLRRKTSLTKKLDQTYGKSFPIL